MAVFLGLDCGGTATRALAANEAGGEIFSGQAGPANLANTPVEILEANLRKATTGCPSPDAVCACIAGLLDDGDRQRVLGILGAMFPRAVLRAEPDFAATLRAALGSDICVIAGTGSLVCSSFEGRTVRSGGRGYLLGDQGSAFQVGRDALNAFLSDPTQVGLDVTQAIERHFGTLEPAEAMRTLYRSPSPASLLGRLAHPLGEDATAGQPYALKSVEENMWALVEIVKEHVLAYFPARESVKMTLAGGLWKGPRIFKTIFESQLKRAMPNLAAQVGMIKRPPVMGALELSMEIPIGNRVP